MKKTFTITETRHKPARQLDRIKSEIKKYFIRERKKDLPEKMDFWDFDCRIGLNETDAQRVHPNDIGKTMDTYLEQEAESFYVEILAKPGSKPKNK